MQTSPEVTVAAIAEQQGKFLMIEERVKGKLVLNQPAGHLENNETLLDAVSRECFEESAWQFEPTSLCSIYTWQHPRRDVTVVRFAFCGTAHSHQPEAELDDGILRAMWLSPDEIRKHRARHRSAMVELAVTDYLAGRRFSLDILSDLQDIYACEAHRKFGS